MFLQTFIFHFLHSSICLLLSVLYHLFSIVSLKCHSFFVVVFSHLTTTLSVLNHLSFVIYLLLSTMSNLFSFVCISSYIPSYLFLVVSIPSSIVNRLSPVVCIPLFVFCSLFSVTLFNILSSIFFKDSSFFFLLVSILRRLALPQSSMVHYHSSNACHHYLSSITPSLGNFPLFFFRYLFLVMSPSISVFRHLIPIICPW